MVKRIGVLAGALFLGVVASCVSAPTRADDQVLDPVVFVPGILGSRLEDDKGIIWGDALATARRFPDLKLSFEHPEKTDVRATEILGTVGILGPFKVGQYSGIKKTFKDLGFVEGQNLFYFPYDWRQSNFVSAAKLAAFIDSKKQLAGKKITIVAHSMGGLVAHIYLHDGGAQRTSRLVTLGTPHLGSADAIWTLWNGLGQLKDFVVGGDQEVQQVLFSFASMYELLPTYDRCCILGAPDAPGRAPTDILAYANWTKLQWIPRSVDSPAARNFVEASLARAARIREIVTHRPENVRYTKIAGDLFKTYTRVYFDSATGKPLRWDQFGGDGTVPLISAAANNLDDSDAAIHVHHTIFDDEHVKLKLRRVLTTFNPLEQYGFQPIEGLVEVGSEKKFVRVRAIDVSAGESYLPISGSGTARVRIEDEYGDPVVGVDMKAWLNPEGGQSIPLSSTLGASGDYVAHYTAPATAGVHKITFEIPGLGIFEDFFMALPK